MSNPSRCDWQGRPARRAERVFESVAPLSVVAARLGIQCETAVTYAPARLLSPPGRHRMILCFSLLFNVLSKSPFESVFNPSRRVHLPEPRLHFLLFSSLLAGLHLLHEILEVLPLEGLEFLLVLLRLVTIGLSYAFEEGGAGLDIVTCPIEEGGEAELLRVLVHLLEARGQGLQFLFLRLSLGNLGLCCLHSQVDFGGLAVVDRPIDEAYELAEIDVVLGLIRASILVFAPQLLKLLKLRHGEA